MQNSYNSIRKRSKPDLKLSGGHLDRHESELIFYVGGQIRPKIQVRPPFAGAVTGRVGQNPLTIHNRVSKTVHEANGETAEGGLQFFAFRNFLGWWNPVDAIFHRNVTAGIKCVAYSPIYTVILFFLFKPGEFGSRRVDPDRGKLASLDRSGLQ